MSRSQKAQNGDNTRSDQARENSATERFDLQEFERRTAR